MPRPGITPAQLLAGAREIAERFPDAELAENGGVTLAIKVDGTFVGYLDLRTGAVVALSDWPSPREPQDPGPAQGGPGPG